MYVDLHIHTNSSDGTWGKGELIENLLDNNINIFSITDHDTIENSKLIISELEGCNLKYMIGVELSCTHMNKEYHITAYSFDFNNNSLLELLESNQRVRDEYNTTTIKLLERVNPKIDYSRYKNYQHDRRRGGWKSLNFLLDEGIVRNLSEYFNLLKDLDVKMVFNDPATVIDIIKEAEGVPFLAHPSGYFNGEKMPTRELKKWIDFGISGIECYTSYGSIEDAKEYVKFCNKNNLLISGGSDCHGTFVPDRKLGNPKVTLDMLNIGDMLRLALTHVQINSAKTRFSALVERKFYRGKT